MPLISRFIGSTEGQAQTASSFYDTLKVMNMHEREIKGRREHGEPLTDYLKSHPDARYFIVTNRVEENISKLTERKRLMTDRGATKEQLKQVNEAIVAHMGKFNDLIKQSRAQQ